MAQFDDAVPTGPRAAAATAVAAATDPATAAAGPMPSPARWFEPSPDAWLEHDRLDAYRVSLEFQQLAARVCRAKGLGALRDQLDRASVSICLNVAEGAGRTSPAEKSHFFSIARGSATECGAALDLLLARGLVSSADHRRARSLLIRIVSMLVGLMRRFSRPRHRPPDRPRLSEIIRVRPSPMLWQCLTIHEPYTSVMGRDFHVLGPHPGRKMQGHWDYPNTSTECWADKE